MPNTLTTFYTLVAGNRAKASHMNINFSAFRGDLIPINTDTATSSDNAHDLGTSEHRWRTGYFGTSLNLEGSTSTTNITIVPDQAATSGGFAVAVGSNNVWRVDEQTGQQDFLINGTTATAIKSTIGLATNTVSHEALKATNFTTGISSAQVDVVSNAIITQAVTITSTTPTDISGSTIGVYMGPAGSQTRNNVLLTVWVSWGFSRLTAAQSIALGGLIDFYSHGNATATVQGVYSQFKMSLSASNIGDGFIRANGGFARIINFPALTTTTVYFYAKHYSWTTTSGMTYNISYQAIPI